MAEHEQMPLSILEIGGGALVEEMTARAAGTARYSLMHCLRLCRAKARQVNHQAKRIAENLLDPNTSFKDARKLKIEMVFKRTRRERMNAGKRTGKAIFRVIRRTSMGRLRPRIWA